MRRFSVQDGSIWNCDVCLKAALRISRSVALVVTEPTSNTIAIKRLLYDAVTRGRRGSARWSVVCCLDVRQAA